jgi:hypothetical protein
MKCVSCLNGAFTLWWTLIDKSLLMPFGYCTVQVKKVPLEYLKQLDKKYYLILFFVSEGILAYRYNKL